MSHEKTHISEGSLILLVGLVQFINILDFMMVMPLGPDLGQALGIQMHHIGYIGGAYTFAAALAGFAGALFLDRYQRRPVLLVSLAGLIVATVSAALATNLETILAARVLAGIFGGPLAAVALAIVTDEVPVERRGAAMGKVMGSFAAASVIGVPFGLELSHRFGWQAPFIAFGVIGSAVWLFAFFRLHLRPRVLERTSLSVRLGIVGNILSDRTSLASLFYTGGAMMAGFMIIPNIAAHLQLNVGFPRDYLGALYFAGGFISFFGMRYAGRFVDKYSATRVSIAFSALLAVVMFMGFIYWQPFVVVMPVLFALFMFSMSGRNVAGQTLSSRVPNPMHRASFMSLQSAMTHMASALGAFLSSEMLKDDGTHLINMDHVAWVAIAITLAVPFLYAYVERRLKATPRGAV